MVVFDICFQFLLLIDFMKLILCFSIFILFLFKTTCCLMLFYDFIYKD